MTTKQVHKYGVDVATLRADDLDKLILKDISNGNAVKVIDIGCGEGAQSIRMANAGATVVGVDVTNTTAKAPSFKFIKADIVDIVDGFLEYEFDLCLIQRTIHYLKYSEALELLKKLKEKVKSKLYISVSGAESDINQHYPNVDEHIQNRFFVLDNTGIEKFKIGKPICLYSQNEFIHLLKESGWEIENCWTSAFGNHKAICF